MVDQYIKNWLIKAENDLTVAIHELNNDQGRTITDAICFHSQQSAEKHLKAFLIYKNVNFGKTHNLEYLLSLCSNIDNSFDQLNIGNLTEYAVEIRYPDSFYIPELDEAKESIELARAIKNFVLEKIK